MGYHGSTSASISASGKPDMHADFGLPFPDFRHTEYPHYYRQHHDGETEEQFATRMADALEADDPARKVPTPCGAFIAEPVMGAGGGLTPPRTYWEKMQAVLRKYDMLFIADEVICGFGRTGNMWGSQTYDLQPDMISCAKALSAGMQPISALMINQRVFEAMLDESRKLGNFAHGFTYAGHPVTTAVAMETLRIYEEMDMIGHVQRVGPYMQQVLAKFADHPLVGDVRGVGLLTGMEMMADKATRTPFDPARERRRASPTSMRARARADHPLHRRPDRVLAAADHHRSGDRRHGCAAAARAGRYLGGSPGQLKSTEGEQTCRTCNRLLRRRARTGWRWRPANPTGGVPAARAAISRSATARTRAAASARWSSRPRKPARCRSAAARTRATSRAATERIGVCNRSTVIPATTDSRLRGDDGDGDGSRHVVEERP